MPELISATFVIRQNIIERIRNSVNNSTSEAVQTASQSFIDDYVRANWSGSVSEPGQPPAIDTGALDQSFEISDVSGFLRTAYKVTSNDAEGKLMSLEYGSIKMLARPFFEPAEREFSQDYNGLLSEKIRIND